MATVGDFIRSAHQAIEKNGELRLRADQDEAQGPRVVVAGTSRWGRFIRKTGWRADLHINITREFGRTVRSEYGERFFRTLPPGLRAELETGMSRRVGSIRSSKRTIVAVEAHLRAHKEAIEARVSQNKSLLDADVANLKNRLEALGGNAYAQFAPDRDAEARIATALSSELATYLAPDFKKGAIDTLTQKHIDASIRTIMNGYLADKGLTMPASQGAKTGALALGQLIKDPIQADGIKELPAFNKAFSSGDIGQSFGRYVVHDRKKLGVEPGFVALKAWTQDDTGKMLDLSNEPPHRYALVASSAYLECMTNDELVDLTNTLTPEELEALRAWLGPDAPSHEGAQQLRALFDAQPDLRVCLLRNSFATLLASIKAGGRLSPQDQQRFEVMKSLVEHNTEKFSKRHYVKLDYHERTLLNKTLGDRVRYARGKREGLGLKKRIFDRAVRWWKSDTPRGLNRSAVKEALANDLTRTLGVPTQKLKLVASKFPPEELMPGEPVRQEKVKLLLDGTHVTGSNPGESYSDLTPYMSGHGERQVLVKMKTDPLPNGKSVMAPEVKTDGRLKIMEVDTSREAMGRYKAVFSLLGDVDAVGSKGQNKGTVGKQFFAIDPGHSLDADSMLGEIPESDFRIKSEGHGTYKNFSVFDQSPFSERIRGLKDTLERAKGPEVATLFGTYRGQFGDNAVAEELSFQEDIDGWKRLLDERVGRFEEKFADRLAVLRDFNLDAVCSGAPGEDRDLKIETARDQILDSLDTLEKISSRHSWTQEWEVKERGQQQAYQLKLAYPEVKARDRTVWTVAQGTDADSDKLVFSMVASSAAACRRFDEFLNSIPEQARPQQMQVLQGGDRITITVPKADVEKFSQVFSMDELSRSDNYTRPGSQAGA